jgi:hypothetical protein
MDRQPARHPGAPSKRANEALRHERGDRRRSCISRVREAGDYRIEDELTPNGSLRPGRWPATCAAESVPCISPNVLFSHGFVEKQMAIVLRERALFETRLSARPASVGRDVPFERDPR